MMFSFYRQNKRLIVERDHFYSHVCVIGDGQCDLQKRAEIYRLDFYIILVLVPGVAMPLR